jgi:hypothetical protein
MNTYIIAQLAENRRKELTAAAIRHRQTRGRRPNPGATSRNRRRRPLTAFRAWAAASQL